MTERLRVADLSVRFGALAALDGIDLTVAAGEVVAVLGPSGSGKSTLLRAIAGLQPLTGGSVALDGVDQSGIPPHRRGVGLMFQDHVLFPHRDVTGNVAFGLRMQGRPAGETAARVDELLALVDLPGYQDRAVDTLSGGEQQRVALARALAPRPRLLLLDEPLGALDRSLREQLGAELSSLFARLGLTVVAVTHDQHEAFAMADRVVLMDAGRVLQVGPPASVWARPADRRAAEVLGRTNLFDVDVVDGAALSPWGPVPVDAADGPATIAISAAAVRLQRGGPVEAKVVSLTFRGDDTLLVVEAPGAPPLEVHSTRARLPAVGATVHLEIEPKGVVVLGR